jgi:hypothetical protein
MARPILQALASNERNSKMNDKREEKQSKELEPEEEGKNAVYKILGCSSLQACLSLACGQPFTERTNRETPLFYLFVVQLLVCSLTTSSTTRG